MSRNINGVSGLPLIKCPVSFIKLLNYNGCLAISHTNPLSDKYPHNLNKIFFFQGMVEKILSEKIKQFDWSAYK